MPTDCEGSLRITQDLKLAISAKIRVMVGKNGLHNPGSNTVKAVSLIITGHGLSVLGHRLHLAAGELCVPIFIISLNTYQKAFF